MGSTVHDNWERLVAAVLKREELWALFHAPSRSPTILSETSSDFDSSSFSSHLDIEQQLQSLNFSPNLRSCVEIEELTADESVRSSDSRDDQAARLIVPVSHQENRITRTSTFQEIHSSVSSHVHNIHHAQLSSKTRNVLLPSEIVLTSFRELLECPVCINAMYPPIYQCHNGHLLCSTCKSKAHNRCPTCRQKLGDIRCSALEKIAESLELPCKYYSLGCPEILPYYSKLKHEALCNFRPYNCPYTGSECVVTGDIPYLVSHLRDDHKVDMHSGCTFNHRYVKSNPSEVENASWMLTVFHCFGQYFCLHFEAFLLGMTPVYLASLRFMGDEHEAHNFSYSLEVGGNGKKLIWESNPRSIRDSHSQVRDSLDGLIIQRNMALFFSGGDRKALKLRVIGRIWKEQQNTEALV